MTLALALPFSGWVTWDKLPVISNSQFPPLPRGITKSTLKVWCYGSRVKGEFLPEERIREVKVRSDDSIQKSQERHNMENTKREKERIKGDVESISNTCFI